MDCHLDLLFLTNAASRIEFLLCRENIKKGWNEECFSYFLSDSMEIRLYACYEVLVDEN
jgi:hypothetical protein